MKKLLLAGLLGMLLVPSVSFAASRDFRHSDHRDSRGGYRSDRRQQDHRRYYRHPRPASYRHFRNRNWQRPHGYWHRPHRPYSRYWHRY
jgi:hypothetical protein